MKKGQKKQKPFTVDMNDTELLQALLPKKKAFKKDKVQLPKGLEELTKQIRGK